MKKKRHEPLPEEALEMVAARFRLLSEPMRLRILQELQAGERTVGELVEAVGAGQANVSKHLAILAGGGLVTRTRRGLFAYYKIADPSVFTLCDVVCGSLGRQMAERERTMRRFVG